MNEKGKREFLRTVASHIGYGGVSLVSKFTGVTGVARFTINEGSKDISPGDNPENKKDNSRLRKPGGGRKSAAEKNPKLMGIAVSVVDKDTYGAPMTVICV